MKQGTAAAQLSHPDAAVGPRPAVLAVLEDHGLIVVLKARKAAQTARSTAIHLRQSCSNWGMPVMLHLKRRTAACTPTSHSICQHGAGRWCCDNELCPALTQPAPAPQLHPGQHTRPEPRLIVRQMPPGSAPGGAGALLLSGLPEGAHLVRVLVRRGAEALPIQRQEHGVRAVVPAQLGLQAGALGDEPAAQQSDRSGSLRAGLYMLRKVYDGQMTGKVGILPGPPKITISLVVPAVEPRCRAQQRSSSRAPVLAGFFCPSIARRCRCLRQSIELRRCK